MVNVRDFGDLSPLEDEMLAKASTGEEIGRRTLPRGDDAEKQVRAALLRALLLGEIEGVALHAKGVILSGANIIGDLDFEDCRLSRPLTLTHTVLQGASIFRDCQIPSLFMGACQLDHLNLERLRCKGSLQLVTGFTARTGVNLRGARLGHNFGCDGAILKSRTGYALIGDSLKVDGNVFFRHGFEAHGEVTMRGASIGGQFDCSSGHIENVNGVAMDCEAMTVGADVFLKNGFVVCGDLILVRARVEGNLIIRKADITGFVSLETARVEEGLFFQGVTGPAKGVDLTDASVGVLRDDYASWENVLQKRLKGFRYDRIDSKITVEERIALLTPRASAIVDFDPQPHTQLAKVMAEHGQPAGAAQLRFEREKHLHHAVYSREIERLGPPSWAAFRYTFWERELAQVKFGMTIIFRWLFGYGHRPARAFLFVAGLWLFSSILYWRVYATGQMAPNSDVVLTSAEWLAAVRDVTVCNAVDWATIGWNAFQPAVPEGCQQPLHIWSDTAQSAVDYETFNPRLYALDLFVPLDALGQETSWAPSKDRGWWGWFGYAMRMPIQMAGWIITAVGAAVVTGLIGRKE